jgi:hypothetical protein
MKSVDELAREVIERVRVIDPLLKWCTPETVASVAGIAFAVLTEETERNRVEREQREVKRTGMTPREEFYNKTGKTFDSTTTPRIYTSEAYVVWLEKELAKVREELVTLKEGMATIDKMLVEVRDDAREAVRVLRERGWDEEERKGGR